MFLCLALLIIMDRADKPVLLKSTRHPFRNMDLAFSREFNQQGQSKKTITWSVAM